MAAVMRCSWCPATEMRALGPCVLCAYAAREAARETRRRALRRRILAALAGAAWLALWAWALAA